MLQRRRWLPLWLILLALLGAASPSGRGDGVESFTPPAIEALLGKLRALQPLPFDKVWRNPPDHPPQERARLAVLTGRLIADGFLVIAAERPQRVEPVGRSLLRMAEALGFGPKIRARGRAVIDKAKKEKWADARRELIRIQAEASSALRALHDDELVTLVSLGGWLRGLEITATAVSDDYSPERSRQLWQPELAASFLEQLRSFRATTRAHPVIRQLMDTLEKLSKTGRDVAQLEKADVQRLRDLARGANDAILAE
jgi:hypothetical protein